MDMQSVSIVGVGRVGGALALALSQKGFTVENLIYRGSETAEEIAPLISPPPSLVSIDSTFQIASEVVFITTPDPEIESVALAISAAIKIGATVFHTSGSLSSEVLRKLQTKGIHTGSVHPLASISDPVLGADRFGGAYFCIEGDEEAVKIAVQLVSALGGIPFSIATEYKALYHAAAVTACGHLVALEDIAIEMLSKCGLDPAEAKKILMPLIKSTVENLAMQSNSEALTGSYARADVSAFERHMSSFEGKVDDDLIQIYLLLGERSLELAEQRGADAGRIGELRERIKIAKRNP
jgi:predicted short-subunit dehydrogenase-like oxidoreductase (DUF2520 family)